MTRMLSTFSISLLAMASMTPLAAQAQQVEASKVERIAPDKVKVSWQGVKAVDVYAADGPDADISAAKLVSANDRDGQHEMAVGPLARPYFFLKSLDGKETVQVGERLVPFEQGSNFRDIGGYPAADGKSVRWGMIFRSGGTPLLSDADLERVETLGLVNLVDLRSSEERVIAPTRIEGVRYNAVGYSMQNLISNIKSGDKRAEFSVSADAIYRNFPEMLVPQLRVLFDTLLDREGPVVYNCSAGQDRTGFATAMILSALGVPRDRIYEDYLLSTGYRNTANEMPHIDKAAHANNPVALFFAKYQDNPEARTPKPLMTADQTPFLAFAFEAVEQKWGSVENYLDQEIGVSKDDIAQLRAAYLQ